MQKIKIGQIGIGHNHGEAKMLAVRKFPELFEIVGFSEDNEEWIKKRGNLKGYEGLTLHSTDELISKCDALLIETDVWDLTETAQKCIDAGKHIHMDKPASGTLTEYKNLLDTEIFGYTSDKEISTDNFSGNFSIYILFIIYKHNCNIITLFSSCSMTFNIMMNLIHHFGRFHLVICS